MYVSNGHLTTVEVANLEAIHQEVMTVVEIGNAYCHSHPLFTLQGSGKRNQFGYPSVGGSAEEFVKEDHLRVVGRAEQLNVVYTFRPEIKAHGKLGIVSSDSRELRHCKLSRTDIIGA